MNTSRGRGRDVRGTPGAFPSKEFVTVGQSMRGTVAGDGRSSRDIALSRISTWIELDTHFYGVFENELDVPRRFGVPARFRALVPVAFSPVHAAFNKAAVGGTEMDFARAVPPTTTQEMGDAMRCALFFETAKVQSKVRFTSPAQAAWALTFVPTT